MKDTYPRKTIEIPKVHQTVTFVLNVADPNILQKNAPNIHNRIHHTLIAHIVVYYIKINTAKTEEKDPIPGNKDTHAQETILDPNILQQNKDILHLEAILDHDTLNHHTTDSNPMIEIVTVEHTKLHIKTKTTGDLVAIPTLKAQAEVDQATTV